MIPIAEALRVYYLLMKTLKLSLLLLVVSGPEDIVLVLLKNAQVLA